MKYISDELVTRLKQAAANGSVVAERICKVLKSINPTTVPQGSYFRLLKQGYGTGSESVSIVYCNFKLGPMIKKIIKEYPDAAWSSRYAEVVTLAGFQEMLEPLIGCATDSEAEEFRTLMGVPSKLTIRCMDSFEDQVQALMRGHASSVVPCEHDLLAQFRKQAEQAAITLKAVGLKRIVAIEDVYGGYLGRAFVWNAKAKDTALTLLDFQCGADVAQSFFYNYAKKSGINVYRGPYTRDVLHPVGNVNTTKDLADLVIPLKIPDNPFNEWIYLPFKGAVFVKTQDGLALSLDPVHEDSPFEQVWSPRVGRYSKARICPFCGKVFKGSASWCPECAESRDDVVGGMLVGNAVHIGSMVVPEVLTRKCKSGYKLTENARISYFLRTVDVD